MSTLGPPSPSSSFQPPVPDVAAKPPVAFAERTACAAGTGVVVALGDWHGAGTVECAQPELVLQDVLGAQRLALS